METNPMPISERNFLDVLLVFAEHSKTQATAMADLAVEIIAIRKTLQSLGPNVRQTLEGETAQIQASSEAHAAIERAGEILQRVRVLQNQANLEKDRE
jgi:hypothetical protein